MKININWKRLFNTFVLTFTIGILIYLCFSENGLIDVIRMSRGFNKRWMSLAVLSHLVNILLDIYLLYIFTNTSKYKYSFKDSAKTSMVGQFFNAITPSASGGQPMQIYVMKRRKIDTGHATSVLIQKFLIYQSAMILYTLIAILLRPKLIMNEFSHFIRLFVVIGFIMQMTVIGLIILFSFNKKITKKILKIVFGSLNKIRLIKSPEEKSKNIEKQLSNFYLNNKNLYLNKHLIFKSYILTFIQISCVYIIPYFIYKSFNLKGEKISDMMAAESFVTMVSSFMPFPGGSGAAEGSFYLFFSDFFTPETIKPAIVIWRFITYFLTIIISAPFSKMHKDRIDIKGDENFFDK